MLSQNESQSLVRIDCLNFLSYLPLNRVVPGVMDYHRERKKKYYLSVNLEVV